MLEQVDM